jgi:phage shock protein PspC (stress-responsive transcriptional regulator)
MFWIVLAFIGLVALIYYIIAHSGTHNNDVRKWD